MSRTPRTRRSVNLVLVSPLEWDLVPLRKASSAQERWDNGGTWVPDRENIVLMPGERVLHLYTNHRYYVVGTGADGIPILTNTYAEALELAEFWRTAPRQQTWEDPDEPQHQS